MKLLIDITDEQYKVLTGQIKKVADEEEFCLSSTEIYNTAYLFLSALESDIVLDGLTNGEVIQKMFPDCTIFPTGNFVLIIDKNDKTVGSFDLDWWNRKWGE